MKIAKIENKPPKSFVVIRIAFLPISPKDDGLIRDFTSGIVKFIPRVAVASLKYSGNFSMSDSACDMKKGKSGTIKRRMKDKTSK